MSFPGKGGGGGRIQRGTETRRRGPGSRALPPRDTREGAWEPGSMQVPRTPSMSLRTFKSKVKVGVMHPEASLGHGEAHRHRLSDIDLKEVVPAAFKCTAMPAVVRRVPRMLRHDGQASDPCQAPGRPKQHLHPRPSHSPVPRKERPTQRLPTAAASPG